MPLDRRQGIGVGGRILDETVSHVGGTDRREVHAVDVEVALVGEQFRYKPLLNAERERSQGHLPLALRCRTAAPARHVHRRGPPDHAGPLHQLEVQLFAVSCMDEERIDGFTVWLVGTAPYLPRGA